jgi:putative secretion ATPase (PEP-CTERM system associated)
MYESHFGFNGSPFQLNPDPAFYFDSRGHSNALAYLKFGAHQGEGFIVVTGEIGAGKTTLVRTLLEGLNPEQVVAAQVVSTQLESGELLQAILMSFGIASASTSKAHLIGSLEAFLTALAAKGRRALLIIDEAQNLKHEAVEELRMLSNFQLGKHGLLQSFLVGQPELRQLLQSKSMEQLRQRVIASCHLGPLQPNETRAYVEHRLRLVGWANRPAFVPDAFERIHHWTGGVPRKINRLCNRLLLGAFLGNDEEITALLVDRTAGELRSEIGELSEIPELPATPAVPAAAERPEPTPPKPAAAAPRVVSAEPPVASLPLASPEPITARTDAADEPSRTGQAAVPAEAAAAELAPSARTDSGKGNLTVVPSVKPVVRALDEAPAPAPARTESKPAVAPSLKRRTYRTGSLDRPVICLVDTTSDFLKAGTLAEVFLKFPALPRLMAFHAGPESSLLFGDTGADELPMPFVGLHLESPAAPFAPLMRQVLEVFETVLSEFNPRAVFAMGSSDAVLACSLLANKRGTALFRIGGGQRQAEASSGPQVNGALIDKISDALYVNRMDSYYTLYQEGIKSDRVLCVGNLVGDMLRCALPHAPSADEVLAGSNVRRGVTNLPSGFAVATVEAETLLDAPRARAATIDFLCELGAELPVIWPMGNLLLQRLQADGAAGRLDAARVFCLPAQGYLQALGLLEKARCLVADTENVLVDEAAALRIPVARLSWDSANANLMADRGAGAGVEGLGKPMQIVRQYLDAASPQPDSPAYWDSGTATRIANHLLLWLPKAEKLDYASA